MIGVLNQLSVKREAVLHPPNRFLKNSWIESQNEGGLVGCGTGVDVGIAVSVTVGAGVKVDVAGSVSVTVGVGRLSRYMPGATHRALSVGPLFNDLTSRISLIFLPVNELRSTSTVVYCPS